MSLLEDILDMHNLDEEVLQEIIESIPRFKDSGEFNGYVANSIYLKSQELVPVDTGFLKKSGEMVYHGFGQYRIQYKAPYASYVHDVIGLNHKKPTQAKYLEDAGYLVAEDIMNETGISKVPFLFHVECDISSGVILYVDSVDDAVIEKYKALLSSRIEEIRAKSGNSESVYNDSDEHEIKNKTYNKKDKKIHYTQTEIDETN